jgi:succinyl-CoA synthetase beta subunit
MLALILICSDTICDMGFASELANYGEYSGAPSEQQTYEYAKTVLSLIVKEKHPDGKILIIGGGIANFTNVAATFKVNLLILKIDFENIFFFLGYCKSIKRVSRAFNRK